MSTRNSDGNLGDRLRDFEGRLRNVEALRNVAGEISTESILLRTRDGVHKYRIQAGTNPGTIEIYDVNGTARRVIAVP